jgi:adenylate cyclase
MRPMSERFAGARRRAVALNSRPELLKALRALRRRLPGDSDYGDPLSMAGDEVVHLIARRVSALERERPSALHEVGLGALQVWQAMSEASGRGKGDREMAVLFTDLVGFSSWALEAGDEAAVELLRQVGKVLESAIEDRGGTIVKRLGDGVMAVFDDPRAAAEAALDAHQALAEIEVEGFRPRMRAGVHHGRPRRLGGDLLGVDVNIAARVAAAAGPGELLLSETTCEKVDGDGFDLGRSKRLKAPGAPDKFRVRAVSRRA